ncbi:hypothetical protein ABZ372_09070 [Streptomyces sp. NPDC005921]|uniref:hypothetical protein n=1 Tax=Streptomyces sp. NPDC005827 TaxID=3157070 RepID=UPI0033DE7C42
MARYRRAKSYQDTADFFGSFERVRKPGFLVELLAGAHSNQPPDVGEWCGVAGVVLYRVHTGKTGECWPQGVNLAEWLTGTLAGSLTVDTVLESQPTS